MEKYTQICVGETGTAAKERRRAQAENGERERASEGGGGE
jgi:hypothetical protein